MMYLLLNNNFLNSKAMNVTNGCGCKPPKK